MKYLVDVKILKYQQHGKLEAINTDLILNCLNFDVLKSHLFVIQGLLLVTPVY